MLSLLSGGFLKGYRTYVLGAVMALTALASWSVGDMSLSELIKQMPEIINGLGLMTIRAAIASQ